jgi:peroxiredoxin (alkyl hydroperoxide reductase subunit C)
MGILVGRKAPLFEADAVINGGEFVEKFSLDQFIGKKYVVLIFYPADFTFVSPTELLAFQDKIDEFEERDVALVGCSVDTRYAHRTWLNMEPSQGGIKGVSFPLVSDSSKTISENFDVLAGEYDYDEEDDLSLFDGEPVAFRGLFLIDKQGIVRHQLVNDMPLGRNIGEVLRIVDALQHFEEHGEVCPANWKAGEKALRENIESVSEYLSNR